MTAPLDLALELAAHGWRVFPCTPEKLPLLPSAHPGKDPLRGECHGECGKEGHGFYDATTDTQKIRTWWKRTPTALVGIACKLSGVFAVDIDNKNGKNGSETLARMTDEYGDLPPGPAQKTPNGGYHRIFRYPADQDIPNNSDRLGDGLDLRSGGYICTGPGYTWIIPHTAELPDAPTWLLQAIGDAGKKTSTQPPPRTVPTPAPSTTTTTDERVDPGSYFTSKYLTETRPGTRNEDGFRLACELRDSGLSEAEAERWIRYYAAYAPGDGYTEREALASLASAYSTPPREAPTLPLTEAAKLARKTAQQYRPTRPRYLTSILTRRNPPPRTCMTSRTMGPGETLHQSSCLRSWEIRGAL